MHGSTKKGKDCSIRDKQITDRTKDIVHSKNADITIKKHEAIRKWNRQIA